MCKAGIQILLVSGDARWRSAATEDNPGAMIMAQGQEENGIVWVLGL